MNEQANISRSQQYLDVDNGMLDHKLPLEMHHRIFANIGEFERWRHLVESASNCRFMMHTKQPHNRRQMMHCSRSEHKLVLQSKR
uniref:F-box domain-containing protein n=1 Tax=Heterorhabditis bacteriophora TaxID=37862 RepID=A0A1I7WFR8_HETBA